MTRVVLLAVVAVLALAACRVTAPETSSSQAVAFSKPSLVRPGDDASYGALRFSRPQRETETMQVPRVTRIESVSDRGGLSFKVSLAAEMPGTEPVYAPLTAGGWQFQAFLNVDRDNGTGYAAGFEFLTRDSEDGLAPGTLVLRRTEGGTGPGGWGKEIARIPVRMAPRQMTFTIPLSAIGDDGIVDFEIDMYATVLGGEDGTTPVAHYVRSYAGYSVPRRNGGESPTPIAVVTVGSAIGGGAGDGLSERRISR